MPNHTHLAHQKAMMVLLTFVSALGVLLLYQSVGQPQRQLFISVLIAVFYVAWGIIYHIFKGEFHLKIVVEYLLIALLSVILLRGAIFR